MLPLIRPTLSTVNAARRDNFDLFLAFEFAYSITLPVDIHMIQQIKKVIEMMVLGRSMLVGDYIIYVL